MSENKRKLRADAVERLKNSVGARVKPDAAIITIVGGRVGQSDWSLECDKLIDLLTDDEQPDTFHDDFYDCESTVDAGEDTREKLEADALALVDNLRMYGGKYAGDAEVEIIGMLDRQAAITEREGREAWHKAASGEIYQAKQEADELREKVRHQSRQLTDTQNALEKRNEEIKPRWKRDTKKLQSRIDALTAERDELINAVNELQKKQPYCYDPSKPVDTLDIVGRYIDELIAERDELRAKYNDLLEHRTKVECDCDCCNWQAERVELRRKVSELRELNDSLHARIESAREALS